jgi:hypothetical protein
VNAVGRAAFSPASFRRETKRVEGPRLSSFAPKRLMPKKPKLTVFGVAIPTAALKTLDKARGAMSRSRFGAEAILRHLGLDKMADELKAAGRPKHPDEKPPIDG